MNGKQAVLEAFDKLFDKAANKLNVVVSPEEKNEAKRDFVERSAAALDIVEQFTMPALPQEAIVAMEEAIEKLSRAELVGYLAAIPLAHQTQEILRRIAYRAAEQRLLEQFVEQADDRYGGN
ncbi:MAG: hypothetical protein HY270_14110 [Deltaproteobacteria bacterium]|nr:hypothetical protein [Deltaproteobacteria bacterium]